MSSLTEFIQDEHGWNLHWQDAVVGLGAIWLMLLVPLELANYNLGANATAYLGGALIAFLVSLSSRVESVEWGVPLAGAFVIGAPFLFDIPAETIAYWSFLGCGGAALIFGLLASAQKTAETRQPQTS
mgnify:CR=1 FL=1